MTTRDVKYFPAGEPDTLRAATAVRVERWGQKVCLFHLVDSETREQLTRPWFAVQGSSPYGVISTAPPRRRPNWESVARPLREKENSS